MGFRAPLGFFSGDGVSTFKPAPFGTHTPSISGCSNLFRGRGGQLPASEEAAFRLGSDDRGHGYVMFRGVAMGSPYQGGAPGCQYPLLPHTETMVVTASLPRANQSKTKRPLTRSRSTKHDHLNSSSPFLLHDPI